MKPSRLALSAAPLALAAAAAACGSTTTAPGPGTPEAPPLTKMLNDAADAAPKALLPADDRSPSRVLAYVNGEVVTYRDVLLRVGPELAKVVGTDREREIEELRALIQILRDRMVDRAAREAGIEITRDELDAERSRRIQRIEKTGTFEAYLAQYGESRREFDEDALRWLRRQRYMRAAIGLGGSAAVRVRAVTDTIPSPREIRAFFERNSARFDAQATGRVRVLAVTADLTRDDAAAALEEARVKAVKALSRLERGEDWVPVYRELRRGDAETDPVDGLYEITERGKHSDWIESFAFDQPRGKRALVNKGRTWYVLQAEGFTPAHKATYEEVQQEAQATLMQLRQLVATIEVELSLLEEAVITPRARYDDVREVLVGQRRQLVADAGL